MTSHEWVHGEGRQQRKCKLGRISGALGVVIEFCGLAGFHRLKPCIFDEIARLAQENVRLASEVEDLEWQLEAAEQKEPYLERRFQP